MKAKIKGPLRFLIAGVLFGIFSVILFFNFLHRHLYFILSLPIGLFFFSLVLIWFYFQAKKGEKPLKKNTFLYVGYMFIWLGLVFAGMIPYVEASQRIRLAIPSVVVLFLGIIILVSFFSIRIFSKTKKEIEKREIKASSVIGLIAMGIGLTPVFLIGIAALIKGKIAGGLIFLGVPILFVSIIVFVMKKSKK